LQFAVEESTFRSGLAEDVADQAARNEIAELARARLGDDWERLVQAEDKRRLEEREGKHRVQFQPDPTLGNAPRVLPDADPRIAEVLHDTGSGFILAGRGTGEMQRLPPPGEGHRWVHTIQTDGRRGTRVSMVCRQSLTTGGGRLSDVNRRCPSPAVA
jgi:hypothetical protein